MLLEYLQKVNFEKKMADFLLEKEMLDISIQNADKLKNKDAFLKDEYTVEEKFDGTKLSLWRNDVDWDPDYTKNWVMAFKNQILFGEEFESTDRESTKKHSVGISQYAFVHDHMQQIHKKAKSIPKNTEFFIEFIQNKLTTTREYKNKHGLYLIAYSPASGEVEGGMLKTKPTGFYQEKNDQYSAALSLNLPPVVFQGKLDSIANITKGIQNPKLKAAWDANKDDYDNDSYETVKKTFLEFESVLGGKTEGVVLHGSRGKIYKFLQADQHDKSVRFAKKAKYQSSDRSIETRYWELINKMGTEILQDMDYDFNKLSYQQILKTFSSAVNNLSEAELSNLFAFKLDAMAKEGKMEQ